MRGTITTLTALAELWIVARSYRPASAKQRMCFVRSLVAVVGDVPPGEVTAEGVLRWWATTDRLAPASRRAAHSAVAGFLRWCRSIGHPAPDVLDHVRRPTVPRRPPVILTDDEVVALELAVVGVEPDEVIVALMLHAGFRRGEVARLRGEHVDHAGGTLVVHGKGGHVDTLPLPPSVARLVPPGTRGPVVGLSADSVAAHVVRAMRRAGVHGRTSHALRRTYATRLMRDGASAVDVMRLLRHSSLATTTSYVRSAIDV